MSIDQGLGVALSVTHPMKPYLPNTQCSKDITQRANVTTSKRIWHVKIWASTCECLVFLTKLS